MRLEQVEAVFKHLKEAHHRLGEEDKETADYIWAKLEGAKLGKLTRTWEENCAENPELRNFTPYYYMLKVEFALIPGLWANQGCNHQEDRQEEEEEEEEDGKDPPKVHLWRLVRKYVIERIWPVVLVKDERGEKIKALLDSAEEAMKASQRQKAKELMDWKTAQIARWQKKLGSPAVSGATTLVQP